MKRPWNLAEIVLLRCPDPDCNDWHIMIKHIRIGNSPGAMTPSKARKIARKLIDMVDWVESKEKER